MRLIATLALTALPLFAHAAEVTVSAAASLTNAFKDLAQQFEAANPGTTVRLNFAASGTLLQQISQGAPVDVFASADQATMDRAASQNLIDTATRRDFVTNSVVLVTPTQQQDIKRLEDLSDAKVQRIAVGKTATVPVGRYTQEALTHAKLWDSLQPKFVQADSVRQVLDYVARGEVDAGFVYRTDAAVMADKVRIALTAGGHTPVAYPVAIVRDAPQPELAKKFQAHLDTPAAREVLDRYGFGRP